MGVNAHPLNFILFCTTNHWHPTLIMATMKWLFSIIFSLFCSIALCQSDSLTTEEMDPGPVLSQPFNKKNSIQFELLGPGVLYSINYERILINGGKLKTSAQTGFAYYKGGDWHSFIFPVSVNQIISFGNEHLEIGLGATPYNTLSETEANDLDVFLFSRIGIRYQEPDGRSVIRGGIFPIFYPKLALTVGFSFGRRF